jgi:hypothetical protein
MLRFKIFFCWEIDLDFKSFFYNLFSTFHHKLWKLVLWEGVLVNVFSIHEGAPGDFCLSIHNPVGLLDEERYLSQGCPPTPWNFDASFFPHAAVEPSLSRSRLRADFCFWIFRVTSMRRCCVFSQEFIGFSAVILKLGVTGFSFLLFLGFVLAY